MMGVKISPERKKAADPEIPVRKIRTDGFFFSQPREFSRPQLGYGLSCLLFIQLLFGAYAPFLNQALEDPAGDPVSATRFLDDVPAFFLKGIRYPVIVLEEHDRDKV